MRVIFNEYEPKDIIRIIRDNTNLTQKEFGKMINKSERTIQDYESGRKRYYAETLKRICDVFDIKITIEK